MIPSCRFWFLSAGVALMLLLVLFPQLSDISKFPVRRYEHLVPRIAPRKGPNAPPVLAYWILGSGGENRRILRLLRAIYHPRNQYLLHLDSSSSYDQRLELAITIRSDRVFQQFGNVDVVEQSYAVNGMGASGLAALLHAAALLLRIGAYWDWFVPLSTSDYPLSTQDEILYALSSLPRDLNFVGYSNDTEKQDVNQIAVDPSLYHRRKTPIFYASETREKPDAFKISGGSPWMILSRGFIDHIVTGMDNLPRKLLMYFNNVAFPLQSYFQTIICNTPEFQNTTVDANLRYIVRDDSSTIDEDLRAANVSRYAELVEKEAIFAGPFEENGRELRKLDEVLLNRDLDRVVPGKWCNGTGLMNESSISLDTSEDFCTVWGDIDTVEPGTRGIKLREILLHIVKQKRSVASHCQSYVVQKD